MHFDLHAVRKVASNGCFSDLLTPAKAKEKPSKPCGSKGSPGASSGIRTPDTLLKRQVLCRLSYWIKKYGVGKGTRTLDPRNHNPML